MKISLPDLKKINPLRQGMYIMLLITFISLICLLFHQKSMFAWNFILSPIFLFCFYNPVIGVFQQKQLQYFGFSLLTFISLLLYIFVSGNFVSEYSYRQAEELHIITALVITFYLLLNLLSLVFRGLLFLLREIDR